MIFNLREYEKMSFESEKSFSDFTNFPRGIRRSGRFSVKESELLEEFGTAMMEIYKGERKPKDSAEKEFAAQIHSNSIPTDPFAKVFKKYLKEISPRKTHDLTASGGDEDGDGSYDSSDDSIE
jgi:hypothetical protein